MAGGQRSLFTDNGSRGAFDALRDAFLVLHRDIACLAHEQVAPKRIRSVIGKFNHRASCVHEQPISTGAEKPGGWRSSRFCRLTIQRPIGATFDQFT
jgi:hypothetical protein